MTRALLRDLLHAAAPIAASLLMVACTSAPGQVDSLPSPPPVSEPAATLNEVLTSRAAAIAGYRDYLQRYPHSAGRDQITRRLADLLVEQAAELELPKEPGRYAAKTPDEQAQSAYREAIELYRVLLRENPDRPDRSEILYQLARAYQANGSPRLALQAVDELLQQGPEGDLRLYADNLFRRAELLFAGGDYAEAARAYRSLIALGGEAPAYEQSLYKLGWSLFREERFQEALPPLFQFLDLNIDSVAPLRWNQEVLPPATAEQVAEVFSLAGRCFAQLGGAETIEPYFSERRRPFYTRQIYLALADWYVEQRRVTAAGATLELLAAQEPLVMEAPPLLSRAISLYLEEGFQQSAITAQHKFVEAYALDGDFWQRYGRSDAPRVVDTLESSLRSLARDAYSQAPEGDMAGLQKAEQWHREYLRWFADEPAAGQMRLHLARILREQGRFPEALAQYEQIAWRQDEADLATEAAVGALRTLDTSQQQGNLDRRVPENTAIEVRERFVEHYPEHPFAPDVLAQLGAELLEQHSYDRAAAIGGHNAAAPGPVSDEFRQVAWSLRAQALSGMRDYPAAVDAYREALDYADIGDERYGALQAGLAMALWQQATGERTAGNNAAAARLYHQAAKSSPDPALRARAVYDEAVALIAEEAWAEAASTLERFRKAFPAHPLLSQASLKLAYVYSREGAETRAAEEYLRVAEDPRLDAHLQREALLEAVQLLEKGGARGQAMIARERYIERFPEPVEVAVGFMQELAREAAAGGDIPGAESWREEIIRRHRNAGSPGTRTVAAQAALAIAENRIGDFQRIRLVQPIKENLDHKVDSMNRAVTALERSIEIGAPAVTAQATYYIASLYDELGRAILDSERPVNLTQDERLEYDAVLVKQSDIFEQRAIAVYSANAARAQGDGDDPWVARSLQRLEELQHGL